MSSQQQQPTSGLSSEMQTVLNQYAAHQEQQNAQQQALHQQQMAQVQQQVQLLQQQIQQQGAQQAPPVHEHGLARHIRKPESFSGQADEDPTTWLHQIDTYFQLAGIRDGTTRISVTGMSLKKGALLWWAQVERNMPAEGMTWDAFKDAFKTRFRPVETAKIARAKLYGLKQYGLKSLA